MIDGPNMYIYVNNNPMNLVDPRGMCTEEGQPVGPKPGEPGGPPEGSQWVPNENYDPNNPNERPGHWETPDGQRWDSHQSGQDGYDEPDHWDVHGRNGQKERIPWNPPNLQTPGSSIVSNTLITALLYYLTEVAPYTPWPDPY